jgi:ribosomal protein S19E (S16A)
MEPDNYALAQRAMTELKISVLLRTVAAHEATGLQNVQVGRLLGIYGGHKGHQGHISRTVLHMLEAEGLVRQDEESKRWFPRRTEDMDEHYSHEQEENG